MNQVQATSAREIADVIGSTGYRYARETELQQGIEKRLRGADYDVRTEVRLSGRDRIDFLVSEVGIEVKVRGSRDALVRQLIRYAAHPQIAELLVVTTRVHHHGIPTVLGGKPVQLLQIGGIL